MKKRLVCICLMLCVFLTGCMPQRNNTTAENRRRVVVILKAVDPSIGWRWQTVCDRRQMTKTFR